MIGYNGAEGAWKYCLNLSCSKTSALYFICTKGAFRNTHSNGSSFTFFFTVPLNSFHFFRRGVCVLNIHCLTLLFLYKSLFDFSQAFGWIRTSELVSQKKGVLCYINPRAGFFFSWWLLFALLLLDTILWTRNFILCCYAALLTRHTYVSGDEANSFLIIEWENWQVE